MLISGYKAGRGIEELDLSDWVQCVELAYGVTAHVMECRKNNATVEEIWKSHGEVILKRCYLS